MTFGRSVVIGKFYPPHRGHKYLIDTAVARSRQVTVIVCAKPTDSIPGNIRGAWLREKRTPKLSAAWFREAAARSAVV